MKTAVPKQTLILFGMAAGVFWACGLIGVSLLFFENTQKDNVQSITLPIFAIGVFLLFLIAHLSAYRFFNPKSHIDGRPFTVGSPAWINQAVLTNTVEQIILAICIWPFVFFVLGSHVVTALAWSFLGMRILFWIGYHRSPHLRAFGFAASFYPTIIAAVVTLWQYLN